MESIYYNAQWNDLSKQAATQTIALIIWSFMHQGKWRNRHFIFCYVLHHEWREICRIHWTYNKSPLRLQHLKDMAQYFINDIYQVQTSSNSFCFLWTFAQDLYDRLNLALSWKIQWKVQRWGFTSDTRPAGINNSTVSGIVKLYFTEWKRTRMQHHFMMSWIVSDGFLANPI